VADGYGAGASRRRREKLKRRRTRRGVVAGAFAVMIAVGVALAVFAGLVVASDYIDTHLGSLDNYTAHPQGSNSIIYAANGTTLSVVASAENRQPVRLAQISPWLQKATVAIEDRRFYQHAGVDWQGVARAAITDITTGHVTQGGSTITQQLVRNLYLSRDVSVDRKLKEMWLALQYEQRYTKTQILDQYLNLVPYGHAAYGAEAAAQTYFHKPAARLTLAQSALLAGLPQAPSSYDPFAYPQAARGRRTEVLQAMLDQQMITQAQYAAAVGAPLGLRRGLVYGGAREPYFVNYVRGVLDADPNYGPAAVRDGGLRVRTTINPNLQKLAYQSMRQILKKDPCYGAPQPSCDPASAIVTIDPRTGHILAMASTASYSVTQFNFAEGRRQPGSTFKPFTLAAAIEQGMDPATTSYVSAPFTIPPGSLFYSLYGPWTVHTADNGYAGRVTVEQATLLSDNTVFAQLALDTGPQNIINVAQRMGIRDSPLQPVPSVTLGSIGITPLELTSAYASFAAQGVYHKPMAVSSITEPDGKSVRFASRGQRVMQDGVAAEVTKILGENMTSGTGVGAHLDDGRPQAGKTGTNSNYVDAWFCGYTPDLATCVWIGYPISEKYPLYNVEGVGAVSGPTLPATIWHIYMTQALAHTPPDNWPTPTNPPQYTNWLTQFTQAAAPPVVTPTPSGSGSGAAGPAAGAGGGSPGGAPGGAPGASPSPTG
jgi:penicillin-binding protein 1A